MKTSVVLLVSLAVFIAGAHSRKRTEACPLDYAASFCLNGGVCFVEVIFGSPTYNCECANGYNGYRCEYKSLDGSYYSHRGHRRFMPEPETDVTTDDANIPVYLQVFFKMDDNNDFNDGPVAYFDEAIDSGFRHGNRFPTTETWQPLYYRTMTYPYPPCDNKFIMCNPNEEKNSPYDFTMDYYDSQFNL